MNNPDDFENHIYIVYKDDMAQLHFPLTFMNLLKTIRNDLCDLPKVKLQLFMLSIFD